MSSKGFSVLTQKLCAEIMRRVDAIHFEVTPACTVVEMYAFPQFVVSIFK